jgi:hypothetical protein
MHVDRLLPSQIKRARAKFRSNLDLDLYDIVPFGGALAEGLSRLSPLNLDLEGQSKFYATIVNPAKAEALHRFFSRILWPQLYCHYDERRRISNILAGPAMA